MSEMILEMKGISKAFAGVLALNGVDFRLYRGESHALLGENGAGKSTLMKILLGLYQPDSGTIQYHDRSGAFRNPAEALHAGISMIHQEISLVPQMTVAENIWLGRENLFLRYGLVDAGLRLRKTEELLRELEIDVDPGETVSALNISSMQLVEIARAVSCSADIIIMDEPTSALTNREVSILYRIVQMLNEKGVAVVFITHKLEEIFSICTRYTVLRDGQYIGDGFCADASKEQLIGMIAGRDLSEIYEKKESRIGDVALEVRDFHMPGVFRNISFQVRRGEVLGFCGLMGAGRSEVMRALFGIDRHTSGTILIDGQEVQIRSPGDAISFGMGMITEDRLRTGSIYPLSAMANTTLVSYRSLAKRSGFIQRSEEMRAFEGIVKDFRLKYNSPDELIGNLSGGNQQKVIISRWILQNSRILIMDEPTRGIDIGAKHEIYRLIERLAQQGMAVLLISSEIPELLGLSDRILVMREGEITFEVDRAHADQETLVSKAFGHA